MEQGLRWVGFAAGLAIVVGTFSSLAGTLVVPRAVPSKLMSFVDRCVGWFLGLFWRPMRTYEAKDHVLALHGPMWLLVALVVWLTGLVIGYGLMLLPFTSLPLGEALRESGSSMLTLGFASTDAAAPTVLDFFAAASGLAVVALEIAYLPTLYNAFSRRETLVTTLESRAGLPAWGPELLWRHQRVGLVDNLPAFYADWEIWCADVAESHTTYPVLIHFRSPHPLRSWITGLIAVLDSAAMYQSLAPNAAPSEARLCLRMGFVSLRAMADALRIPYERDPSPDQTIDLPFSEFEDAVSMLAEGGFPMERTAAEAWPHFRGWRVNYEHLACTIADRIVAVPGRWTGTRRDLAGIVIEPRRPIDRTPTEPEGTDATRST